MASSGYILNGVYHKTKQVPLAKLVKIQQTMFKQGDFARQRFDHSAEILQPYDHTGKPNTQFIEAYPEAAEEYGFIPKTQAKEPRESDTPTPERSDFGGSIPWDYQLNQKP